MSISHYLPISQMHGKNYFGRGESAKNWLLASREILSIQFTLPGLLKRGGNSTLGKFLQKELLPPSSLLPRPSLRHSLPAPVQCSFAVSKSSHRRKKPLSLPSLLTHSLTHSLIPLRHRHRRCRNDRRNPGRIFHRSGRELEFRAGKWTPHHTASQSVIG